MLKFLSRKNFKGNVKLITIALIILMLIQMLIIVFISNSRRLERFNDTAAKAFTASAVSTSEIMDSLKEIVLSIAAERDVNFMMLSNNITNADIRNFRRTVDDVRERMQMNVDAFYVYNDKTHTLYDRAFNRVHIDNMPESRTKSEIISNGAVGYKISLFLDKKDFLVASDVSMARPKVLRVRYFPSLRSKSCIIADVNISYFKEIFKDYNKEFSSQVFIFDSKNELLYADDEEMAKYVEVDMPFIKGADFSSPVQRNYGGEKHLVIRYYSEKTGLSMLSLIPDSAIKVDFSETKALLYTNLSLAIALLVVLMFILIVRWIHKIARENLRQQQLEEETGRHNKLMSKKQHLINCLFKPDEQDICKAREYISALVDDDKAVDDESYMSLFCLEIYAYDSFAESHSNRDMRLYKYGISNICEEIINKYVRAIDVLERDGMMVYLVVSPDIDQCRKAFAECQTAVSDYIGISISAILSNEGDINSLPDMYADAQQLSEYKFMVEEPAFFDMSMIERLVSVSEDEMNERLDKVCADLADGNREELGKLYEWLRCLFLSDAKNVMWILMFRLFNIGKRNARNLGSTASFATRFNSVKSLTEMKSFFEDLIAQVFVVNEKDMEQNEQNDRIQTVRDIIERNFRSSSFCSADVAEEMELSKAYLSQKFKQATGISISEAINDRRMEAFAGDLLTTDKSVKTIIENVGGVNHNYFMMMFKKKYGMTPTEYRREFKLH